MNFDITKPNIGSTDRIIRVGIAALLLLGALRGGSWIAGLLGVALLATAYFRFCPAYTPFNFNTNKETEAEVK